MHRTSGTPSKKYNLRDVETEMGIQQRLAKFPVSQTVWDEYHQSEEINDTGVRLDMELVAQAIEMDTLSRQKLTASMKHMTALENPNSVQQMKQWLSDNGMETDSLDEKSCERASAKKLHRSLRMCWYLRQQLAKVLRQKNIRRWKTPYALTVVPEACSRFYWGQPHRTLLRS